MGIHKNSLGIAEKIQVLDFVRGNRDLLNGKTLTEIYDQVLNDTGHACGRSALKTICQHAEVEVKMKHRKNGSVNEIKEHLATLVRILQLQGAESDPTCLSRYMKSLNLLAKQLEGKRENGEDQTS